MLAYGVGTCWDAMVCQGIPPWQCFLRFVYSGLLLHVDHTSIFVVAV